MEFVGSNITTEEGNIRRTGRLGRRRVDYNDDTREFKSKNLMAERKRRQKLSDRLLALRALVPIITNMNKATIIEDAITYIQELQTNVENLSNQLLEMDAISEEEPKKYIDEIDSAEEMKKHGIMEDVQVTDINGNKLWIKIILEKKRGNFSKLLENMTKIGLQLTDTNVTTTKGAFIVSSCVESAYGETLSVQQTKNLLLDIIRRI